MIPFIAKSTSIVLFPAGRAPLTIDSSHPNFVAVREAIAAADYEGAVALADVPAFIAKVSAGKVTVTADGVFYNGEALHNYLTQRMLEFMAEGLPFEHYCCFLENVMDNPSMVSRKELYLFLEAANLPITDDGCFLAYKAVRSDYTDKHTGKFDNSPGAVLEMERREVDDDRTRACSYGFHAAAYDYAKNFLGANGDRLMVVKINPRDVVSVPSDYQNQKLRTCRYEVVSEISGAFDTLTGRKHVSSVTCGNDDWDDWFDENVEV